MSLFALSKKYGLKVFNLIRLVFDRNTVVCFVFIWKTRLQICGCVLSNPVFSTIILMRKCNVFYIYELCSSGLSGVYCLLCVILVTSRWSQLLL